MWGVSPGRLRVDDCRTGGRLDLSRSHHAACSQRANEEPVALCDLVDIGVDLAVRESLNEYERPAA